MQLEPTLKFSKGSVVRTWLQTFHLFTKRWDWSPAQKVREVCFFFERSLRQELDDKSREILAKAPKKPEDYVPLDEAGNDNAKEENERTRRAYEIALAEYKAFDPWSPLETFILQTHTSVSHSDLRDRMRALDGSDPRMFMMDGEAPRTFRRRFTEALMDVKAAVDEWNAANPSNLVNHQPSSIVRASFIQLVAPLYQMKADERFHDKEKATYDDVVEYMVQMDARRNRAANMGLRRTGVQSPAQPPRAPAMNLPLNSMTGSTTPGDGSVTRADLNLLRRDMRRLPPATASTTPNLETQIDSRVREEIRKVREEFEKEFERKGALLAAKHRRPARDRTPPRRARSPPRQRQRSRSPDVGPRKLGTAKEGCVLCRSPDHYAFKCTRFCRVCGGRSHRDARDCRYYRKAVDCTHCGKGGHCETACFSRLRGSPPASNPQRGGRPPRGGNNSPGSRGGPRNHNGSGGYNRSGSRRNNPHDPNGPDNRNRPHNRHSPNYSSNNGHVNSFSAVDEDPEPPQYFYTMQAQMDRQFATNRLAMENRDREAREQSQRFEKMIEQQSATIQALQSRTPGMSEEEATNAAIGGV